MTVEGGTIAVVVNGASPSRRRERAIRALETAFGSGGDSVSLDVRMTAAAGDGVALAREAAESGARIVVAAGGDGTVQEVARGIAGSEAALGVMPVGTANDFARGQAIPSDFVRAAECIAAGKTRSIDLLRVNDDWVITGMGCGVLASVALACKRYLPYARGFGMLGRRAIYLLAALEQVALRPLPDMELSLTIDGEAIDLHAAVLVANNQKSVGGLFTFTPQAEVDDGLVHVCLLDHGISRLRHPGIIWRALRGTLSEEEGILIRSGRILDIQSPTPVACTGDGELLGASLTWRIEAVPGMLPIIVP